MAAQNHLSLSTKGAIVEHAKLSITHCDMTFSTNFLFQISRKGWFLCINVKGYLT
jgi:hypothetical protein